MPLLQLGRRVEREVGQPRQHPPVTEHAADDLVAGAHGDGEGRSLAPRPLTLWI